MTTITSLIMALQSLIYTAYAYYAALAYYSRRSSPLQGCRALKHRSPLAAIWLCSLARTPTLWTKRHYRSASFGADIRANLRNVAVPCTGIPMHWFLFGPASCWVFLIIVYPLAALVVSVYLALRHKKDLGEKFEEHLLQPRHWFARWRLNCFLVAWHAMAHGDDETVSKQYLLEGKGEFLLAAEVAGVPISPFRRDLSTIFAKHVNVEGGMGIHVLRNFTAGGKWIIQDMLSNDAFLERLLPSGVPLSTLRVVTASRHGLPDRENGDRGEGRQGPRVERPPEALSTTVSGGQPASQGRFSVLTAVLRAGRVGAATDHDSVCFPVDSESGELAPGGSNQHWYKLGVMRNALRVGNTFGRVWATHPDDQRVGSRVSGKRIPDMPSICKLCTDAHRLLLPDVPLVGWDVALTREHGPALLELNISCNFFMGRVDERAYAAFMQDHISVLMGGNNLEAKGS